MSNPYQTPATETAWTTPGLDLASMAPLRGAILTLRIIVIALVLGVVGFGTYTVAYNASRTHWATLTRWAWSCSCSASSMGCWES